MKTQQSVCNHCELLPISKKRWSGPQWMKLEDFDLSNITDDENANEFGTSVFDTEKVVPIWSDETED